jgi:geranylgeranyl diphosphate synthase, type I
VSMSVLNNREWFEKEQRERREKVLDYLYRQSTGTRIAPPHLAQAVHSYLMRGGKCLRSFVLLLSCGAMGGDEQRAIPAAAAVEIYHTWTLVHDDIIDRDETRRGGKSVHRDFEDKAINEFVYQPEEAKQYGLSLAILAGDAQHAWAISLLTALCNQFQVSSDLVINLIRELETDVINTLLEGETLDVQYACQTAEEMKEDLILEMLWKKTGKLYEYCGRVGGLIALDHYDPTDKRVEALASFTSKCGLAFQLQDDILGIVGNAATLGKPIWSDLLEGKKTLIIYRAFHRAGKDERKRFLQNLGNKNASKDELEALTKFIINSGSITYTQERARAYIKDALQELRIIPESRYRDLLYLWAESILDRQV